MEASLVGSARLGRLAAAIAAAVTVGVLAAISGALASATPAAAQPVDDEAPQLSGRIRYEDEDGKDVYVDGVEITVESADGSFTETVTTDDDGAYEVQLPAPGIYTAKIDTGTLPEGVTLRDASRETLQLDLSPNQKAPLIFQLTTGDEAGAESTWSKVPSTVVNGLRFGLVLAMCAIGLSLIFGTTGLVNFAHGDMVTFGAIMAFFFNQTVGMSLLIATPLAVLAGALFGGIFNRGVWRPLRERGTGLVAMMIVSFGIGLAVRYVFLYQFQGRRRTYSDFSFQPHSIEIGPVDVVPRDLWIMGISIAVLVGVGLFLQRTRLGKAMRAVSDDPDLAESSGIDVERVIAWVWITGGGLAALGGIFQGLDQKVQWQTGNQLLLLIFAGVILGGLGTSYGALVGSIAIGLFVDPELRIAMALLIMIIALLIRPQGILGYSERVG